MPNIASVLKEEITRLIRKEFRIEAEAIKKANSQYKSEIVELKKRIAALEEQLKADQRTRQTATQPVQIESTEGTLRFRSEGLKKLRERLELSAPILAGILGVSPQTIYNWETGTSKPGKQLLANIAVLRKMGKKEVRARLAQSSVK